MDLGLLLRMTPALGVGAFVAWVAALAVGLSASSVDAVIVLRTLLTAAILLLLTRILVRRAYAGPALTRTVLLAAVISYALTPSTWVGRTLVGQLLLEPGVGTLLVDLVVWLALVMVAARSVESRAVVEHRPYQLG